MFVMNLAEPWQSERWLQLWPAIPCKFGDRSIASPFEAKSYKFLHSCSMIFGLCIM